MLIFFDIDGTLIGEESYMMPESAKRAIEQARRNGHSCMINTGRTRKMVGPDITGLTEFDGLLMGCGTMITYHGEVLLHRTFSEQEAMSIIDGMRRYRIDAVLEGCENNFLDREERMFSPYFIEYMKQFAGLGYGTFEEAVGHFDKFYAYVEDTAYMDSFRAEFGGWLDFVDRQKGFFEIIPKGDSKASAMEYLAKRLGVSMEETAAIGDSSNDIPMIKCARYGIAMGNATTEVKALADYVTTDVDRDGIRNALDWLGVL